MKTPLTLAAVAVTLLGTAFTLPAQLAAGRALEEGKTFTLGIHKGTIHSIDGKVQETKRAGADEVTSEGRFLERYDFGDFGYDSSEDFYGFFLEKNWRFVSLLLDLGTFQADASARAKRVYAIGVDDVEFGGETYDYMLIPSGRKFKSEIQAAMMDLKLQANLFHITGYNGLTISPWLLFGIYAIGGEFEIDAGKATGVTTYEYDPYLYVVGGKGEGTIAGFAPQFGFGGEVRFPLFYMNKDTAELAITFNYAFLDFTGNSGDFGVSSRNEKDVELDFKNVELKATLDMPISKDTEFFVGIGLKQVSADAEIEAQRRPPGQTTTEKYDKVAELTIDSSYFMLGLNF